MKRFLTILLSAVLLLGTVPMTQALAASEDVNVSITADKTVVNPGDEITFTISLAQTGNLAAIEMGLDIPSGLTYVANSGALDAELRDKLNTSESLTFTESSRKIVWADPSNYWTSEDELKIATFKCAVDTNATLGNYSISVNEVQFCDENFEIRTHNVNNATINVVAPNVDATGVTLNKDTLSLIAGESETLIATVAPSNATNQAVTWTSSDSSVATVDSTGKVEALKKGTAKITATTTDGGYTDTCVVTVTCNHGNTTTHPAKASTCKVQGNVEYVTCDDCGVVVSGSDAKLPLAAHQLTKHDAVAADHENGGNIDYWTCDVCSKYFSDEAGAQEITESETKTDKIPHSYSTTWSENEAQHWHECGCGNKIDIADHNYDNACDTECNTCGHTRSVTHNYSTEWSGDGVEHWHECTICHDKKDVASHVGGTATCTEKAVCTECQKAYGEFASCNYIEKVDSQYLKSEANCASPAVYYKSCSACNTASSETFEVGVKDTTKHTGNTEVKDAVKRTCTTDGYSGNTYCKDCGKKLEDGQVVPAGHDYGTGYKTDAENHWKECGCGNVIEKAAHSFGDWKVVKEATATAVGSKEKVCSVCGYKISEKIPMLKAETSNTDSPKTEDNANSFLWISFALASFFGAAVVLVRKKKYMK